MVACHTIDDVPMTRQEALSLLTAIGLANTHPDMSPQDRQVATWMADRIERHLNRSLSRDPKRSEARVPGEA